MSTAKSAPADSVERGVNTPTDRPVFEGLSTLFLSVALFGFGHGLQGTLLGVRATTEGFGTVVTGAIMAAYYVGFLGGTRFAVRSLGRVGHIRAFAALASTASSAALIYVAFLHPAVWVVMRFLTGFCFAGMYVVNESWFNERTDNANRGRVLSAYLVTTMLSVAVSQVLFVLVPSDGPELFIASSVLLSLSLVPLALSGTTQPAIVAPEPLSVRALWAITPTGVVVVFLTGLSVGALRGLSPVYAATIGLSSAQIALFVGAITLGASVLQTPLGWGSDHLPRRFVMMGAAVAAAVLAATLALVSVSVGVLIVAVALLGGFMIPMYSLGMAYTNDWLDSEQRVSAAALLILINGAGAIVGPLVTGFTMRTDPTLGFFGLVGATHLTMAVYLAYRMARVRAPQQSPFRWLTNRGAGLAVLRLVRGDQEREP